MAYTLREVRKQGKATFQQVSEKSRIDAEVQVTIERRTQQTLTKNASKKST
jgi:hypothetical protein